MSRCVRVSSFQFLLGNTRLELAKMRLILLVFTMLLAGCKVSTNVDKTVYVDAVELLFASTENVAEGSYDLAKAHERLSVDGKIVVRKIDTDLLCYIFVLWRGRGSNFEGIGYIPNIETIKDLPASKNYYGDPTIIVAPTRIDGAFRNVDATITTTETKGVFLLSYNLD